MCMIAVSEGCQYWGFDLSLNPALFIKSGIDHRLDLFFAIFFFFLGIVFWDPNHATVKQCSYPS